MNNIKCIDCGLVNWASDIECRRCGSLLTVQEKRAQILALEQSEAKPFLTSGLQLLLVLLGLELVVGLVSQIFQLPTDLAAGASLIAVAIGFLLLIVCHIWLLARIFEQSVAWGLGALFVPLVGIIAIGKFWEHTKRSFVGQLICVGIVLMAMLFLPGQLKPRTAPVQRETANRIVLPIR